MFFYFSWKIDKDNLLTNLFRDSSNCNSILPSRGAEYLQKVSVDLLSQTIQSIPVEFMGIIDLNLQNSVIVSDQFVQ